MKNLYHFPRPFCEEEGGGGGHEPTLAEILAQIDGKYTLDEIFAESKGLQSQFDKKVSASNETVRKKTEEKVKALYDDKISEQEKMAKMNEVEKAEYEFQKKVDALEKREKDLIIKERRNGAISILKEKGIPDWVIGSVNLESDETVSASISELETKWSETRKSVVDDALGKIDTTIKDSRTEGDGSETDPFEEKMNKYMKG